MEVKEEKLKILVVEPHKEPYVSETEDTLEAMQELVGGLIEDVELEECVSLICNEESKLLGMDGNRRLGNDIIAGTFFIIGANDMGEYGSLPEDKLAEYMQRFQKTEEFTPEEVEESIRVDVIRFSEWNEVNQDQA